MQSFNPTYSAILLTFTFRYSFFVTIKYTFLQFCLFLGTGNTPYMNLLKLTLEAHSIHEQQSRLKRGTVAFLQEILVRNY